METDKPLLFISHKHADRAIANVVRSFVTEQTSGKVDVFQSSDPAAINPGVGHELTAELKGALWRAGAVILIYTTPDQDWGYCMWECGVATNPESPDTKTILFQCSDSSPSLFSGQVLVNAREKASIETFARQFMTQKQFIARHDDKLTGYDPSGPEVQRAANKLFDDLQAVLPEWPTAEWPAHPYLQLELPSAIARAIAGGNPDQLGDSARRAVMEGAVVSESDKYAHALFGMAQFEDGMRLERLYEIWRTACPKRPSAWIESLADQVTKAAQWQFPVLRWTAMTAVNDGGLRAPVVTRVRRLPWGVGQGGYRTGAGRYQFDVYFYPFNLLEATPIGSRMVKRSEMFCKVLEPGGEPGVKIADLLGELDEQRCNRVPFVDSRDRLVYIAHRSELEKFFSRQIRRGKSTGSDLTLADALADQPEIRAMFTGTAAFVCAEGTMGDAKLAMNGTRDCYDVFVTENGGRDEPVLGWVTDVIIAASEPS